MKSINQFLNPTSSNDLEEAVAFADRIGYPIIIRPAYTLGGTGGGGWHITKMKCGESHAVI